MKRILLAATLAAVFSSGASADEVRPISDPETLKACGECHMAFQPAFLPARSWNKIMDGLANHFGDNASMAADKTERIRKVLVAGAADMEGSRAGAKALRGIGGTQVPLRITETPRFMHKHADIPERVWKRPDVVSRSNCAACHKGAEQGSYEDE